MASMGFSAATPQGNDIAAMKTAIYEACVPAVEKNPNVTIHQRYISDLNIIPKDNVNLLLTVIQALVDEKLFKVITRDGNVGWKLRSVEEAKKYRSLKMEQEIVYSLIDEAGDEGMWSKTIKARSGLHDAVFRSAIKHLESKAMISDMKSVEHPTRKMYIKSSIRPSDRATGGSWYTDSELDEEFIEQLMNVLYDYIRKMSFYRSSSGASRKPKKTTKKLSPEEAKALRNERLGPRMKTEDRDDEGAARKRRYDSYLPMPAGYRGYPTLNELTAFIENAHVSTTTLMAAEIQQLLDLLCYDDRIEKVISGPEGVAYKALRKSLKEEEEGRSSALTEAPCGRCPVFDLCEEGGPVGPSNCEYFNDWLSL